MGDNILNVRETGNGRYYMLDSLKGSAIIFVIVTHLGWTEIDRQRLGFYFWIEMAVPIFMLVTGYLHAASLQRGGVTTSTVKRQIIRSLVKYSVPFVLVYVIELSFFTGYTLLTTKSITVENICDFFLKYFQGGWGPGSYYYPVLVQIVFLFPYIFYVVDRFRSKGLLLCGVANILFEIIKFAWNMSADTYRMLAFRYVFVLAFGCWLFVIRERGIHAAVLALCALVGGTFITMVVYFGYKPIIFNQWSTTCMISALLAVPCVYACLRGNLRCRPLEKIGEASYAIFLTQMVWFGCGGRKFIAMISESLILEIVSSLAACITAGMVFHVISGKLTKYALTKLEKSAIANQQ